LEEKEKEEKNSEDRHVKGAVYQNQYKSGKKRRWVGLKNTTWNGYEEEWSQAL
jgi:hypothetical protein